MTFSSARVLTVMAPGRLAWVDASLPPLGAADVLIEAAAGAVSIGSELPIVRGTARSPAPVTYPTTTGYETIGIVREAGAEVRGFGPGDRVIAFSGHVTAAVVSATRVILVPPAVPNEIALLAILTCDVAKGIRKLAPSAGQTLLVTGAGAIGLLTIWMARQLGLGPVDVVEPIPDRRHLATGMGARRTAAPGTPADLDDYYPYGIECSSDDGAFSFLQSRIAAGGRICVLADGNTRPLTLSPVFHARELTIVGSSDGEDYAGHARWLFAQPAHDLARLAVVFDLRITADGLIEAFGDLAEGRIAPVKIFVDYAVDP